MLDVVYFSVGDVKFTCSSVTYFPAEHYRPDDQDSTTAIPCQYQKRTKTKNKLKLINQIGLHCAQLFTVNKTLITSKQG